MSNTPSKHTPGPWDAPRGGYAVYGPNGVFVAQSLCCTGADTISGEDAREANEAGPPDEEAAANARLMSMSPEMYDAIVAMLPILRQHSRMLAARGMDAAREVADIYCQCQRILAHVRGEVRDDGRPAA